MENSEFFFSPKELAKRWRVHANCVYGLIRANSLPVVKIGKESSRRPAIRIPLEAVKAYEAKKLAVN
jgi:excisionase family DNA binding protein